MAQGRLWLAFSIVAVVHVASWIHGFLLNPNGKQFWYFTVHTSTLTLMSYGLTVAARFRGAFLGAAASWAAAYFLLFTILANASATTGYWLLDRGQLRSANKALVAQMVVIHTVPLTGCTLSLLLAPTQELLREPLAAYTRTGFALMCLPCAAAHIAGQLVIGALFLEYHGDNRYAIESETEWGWNVLLAVLVMVLAAPLTLFIDWRIIRPAARAVQEAKAAVMPLDAAETTASSGFL